MFKKILVANRGEIAVRIIRACRDLGISPVTVHSDIDGNSLAVKIADEAYCIGGAAASESYLNIEKIVETAVGCGAEAVHPGYGFLAENSHFVEAVEDAGLVFIGPSVESMSQMGDKIASRSVVQQARVPVVPGSEGCLSSLDEAMRVAEQIGYPVMLKASAGGGGKGMRLVRHSTELRDLYATTRSEAESSFKNSSVYLEKYISRPRHIEVQVLGDRHGNLVHLGERECSIQRRHQKVVEESPSPLVDSSFREQLGTAALAVARAVGYYSAGTVEFLVDDSASTYPPPFYFLEMNTRLQVEHPVTEMITSIDLVKEQIRIAADIPLAWNQEAIQFLGAAIECRIYAEDPQNNFYPSPGKIETLFEPSGPGVRNDSGVFAGSEISIHYDPLISKLVAHGRDRQEAVSRMRRALGEYKIGGVQTTIPFFEALLSHPSFVSGDLHTHFIEEHRLADAAACPSWHDVPAIAAAICYYEQEQLKKNVSSSEDRERSAWKEYGRFASRLPWR